VDLTFIEGMLPSLDLPWDDFWRALQKKAGYAVPDSVWAKLEPHENDWAFTTTLLSDLEQMETVLASLVEANAEGMTFREWTDTLDTRFEEAGWTSASDLPPSRLELIYRVQTSKAQAAAKWEWAQEGKDIFPYLMYSAIGDDRVREDHWALNGLVYAVDDPFWQSFYPPWDYNCRCDAISVSQDEVDENSWEVQNEPPEGVSPSDNFTGGPPDLDDVDDLQEQIDEKLQTLGANQ
jgi:SPP1 gp7 family putative phage head morphogenesis protein